VSVLIDAERLRALTPWPKLIDALQSAFREPCEVPERLHFDIDGAGSLIIMPAWQQNGFLGVKVVQVFPGNSRIGKPTVHGMYMLASAGTGEVLSFIDAQELTARRTAATSALASRFLSRDSSRCLLVMGTGRLAAEVIGENGTRELHEQKRHLLLLEAIATASNLGGSVDAALTHALQQVCDFTQWPLGHVYLVRRTRGSPNWKTSLPR